MSRSHGQRDRRISAPQEGPRSLGETLQWIFFCTVLCVMVAFGGASRDDVPSQVVVRVVAIIAGSIWAMQLDRTQFREMRTPLLFALAIVAIVAVQLVPLPPGLWSALPGRGTFAEGYALADVPLPWHAISLTPDRTWNSLLGLLPGIAIMLGIATLPDYRMKHIPEVLMGLILLGALIAIAQISTRQFYFYNVTNIGSAVGFFANRNHQAAFIACYFPLLACWALAGGRVHLAPEMRAWLGVAFATLLLPLLLLTGSRAGIVLGLIGIILALALTLRSPGWRMRLRHGKLLRWLLIGATALAAIFVVATIYAARDEALRRLIQMDAGADLRLVNLPIYMQMAWDFFPFGSGFGSFDPVFRTYEPLERLSGQYLNQAHNDLMQIAIEGGVSALLVAVAMVIWIGWSSVRLWFGSATPGQTIARAGFAMLAILLVGSLLDYPLRTPALSTLAFMALAWMGRRAVSDPKTDPK